MIFASESGFYTCDQDCDFDICKNCAECTKGHTLSRAVDIVRLNCNRCQNSRFQKFECTDTTHPECRFYSVCEQCLKLP